METIKAIGVKLVELVPMTAQEAKDKGYKISNHDNEYPGYEVTYQGGYKSWTPKEVADNAYFPLTNGEMITKEDIDNMHCLGTVKKVGTKTTLVMDTTLTGFDLTATSACVKPERYDSEIGAEIARKDIIDELWGHMGFVLQWARNGINFFKKEEKVIPFHIDRMIEEYNELCEKINKLKAFIDDDLDGSLFPTLDEDEQIDMKDQLCSMKEYLSTLRRRLSRAGIDIPQC